MKCPECRKAYYTDSIDGFKPNYSLMRLLDELKETEKTKESTPTSTSTSTPTSTTPTSTSTSSSGGSDFAETRPFSWVVGGGIYNALKGDATDSSTRETAAGITAAVVAGVVSVPEGAVRFVTSPFRALYCIFE